LKEHGKVDNRLIDGDARSSVGKHALATSIRRSPGEPQMPRVARDRFDRIVANQEGAR
jgi:hypothetical protein